MKLKLTTLFAGAFYMSGNAQGNDPNEVLWYSDPVLWAGGAIFLILLFIYVLYKLVGGRRKTVVKTETEVIEHEPIQAPKGDVSFDQIEKDRNGR